MKEILLEKNKSIYLDYFSIEKNKFIIRRILMALMVTILYVMVLLAVNQIDNIWYLLGIAPSLLIGYKIPYIELVSKKGHHDLLKEYMFPNFLRYFVSLISTQGNVYLTLKETTKYVNDPLKVEVETLIKKLEDKKVNNHLAFMEFAENIGTSEAMMIMNMIDEFNEHGISKDDISQLENTVIQLQENKTNELIEYKAGKVETLANPILIYTIGYIFAFVMISYVAYMAQLQI